MTHLTKPPVSGYATVRHILEEGDFEILRIVPEFGRSTGASPNAFSVDFFVEFNDKMYRFNVNRMNIPPDIPQPSSRWWRDGIADLKESGDFHEIMRMRAYL